MLKKIFSITILLITLVGAFNSSYAMSKTDLELFYRTVEAEATGQGYNGKLAVANVILNRNNSTQFPNTVRGVITQKGQFCVIKNGRVNRVKVTEETIQAVNDALQGKWIMSDKVLFFYNPRYVGSNWISRNRAYWGQIAEHRFYY